MSTSIHNNSLAYHSVHQEVEDNTNFNDLVLEHLKMNRPDGKPEQMLNKMQIFSPKAPILSAELLQSDPDYINPANDISNIEANRLLCLNMLRYQMLYDMLNKDDENKDLIMW